MVALYLALNFLFNRHRLTDPITVQGTTLIMGDSHLRTAVDPELLTNTSNICRGAEPYVMTYFKLKRILQDNSQIERVILGFSYNSFSGYQDIRLTGTKAGSQFSRYYEVLPLSLLDQIDISKSKFYQTYVGELALYPNFSERFNLGGFQKHEPGIDKANLMETINKHFYPTGEFIGTSNHAKIYLDSIVHLTKDEDISLILLAAPLHAAYRERVPAEIKDYFTSVKLDMKKQGVLVLDFLDRPTEDVEFKDYDHLCYLGAKEFTKLLEGKIKPR